MREHIVGIVANPPESWQLYSSHPRLLAPKSTSHALGGANAATRSYAINRTLPSEDVYRVRPLLVPIDSALPPYVAGRTIILQSAGTGIARLSARPQKRSSKQPQNISTGQQALPYRTHLRGRRPEAWHCRQ